MILVQKCMTNNFLLLNVLQMIFRIKIHDKMIFYYKNALQFTIEKSWCDLVSLFNGISTFMGYLMPNPFFWKNSYNTI